MADVLAVCDEYRAPQWAMVIHVDETVVQVLKEDSKPVASESGMRLYASGEYSKNHVRIFEYQPDRSGKRPESFLKGFTGCLVTKGYHEYNQVAKVTRCGCWAHARRKCREGYRQNVVFPLLEKYFA